MHEKGVTESAAREHVKQVISNTWKKMNSDKFSGSVYPELVVDAIQSFARASHCLYQFGDGYGVGAEPLTKGHIISLFLEPIPMAYDETY
ncbi:hypothetical protein MKW92_015645 [Papaver armeniacum]|nr:hypothetical protein MKW92_015645 [Papaver armeniacum]